MMQSIIILIQLYVCMLVITSDLRPCLFKHPVICELRHPAPERCGREADAIVVVSLYPFDEDTAQTLDRETASTVNTFVGVDVGS
jgi:hypothetical protein